MIQQAEFTQSLFRQRKIRAKAGPKAARKMIAVLIVKRTWTTRREFAEKHGLSDRECRLGRECSHGRIIRGQLGYKLVKDATPDEIAQASAAWLSQIKAEQREHAMMMRRAHQSVSRQGGAMERMNASKEKAQ